MEQKVSSNLGGREKVLFLGSKEFGLKVFKHILNVAYEMVCAFITIDDSDDGRSALNEIKAYCISNHKPIEVISSSKDIELCIAKYKPDIGFVVCWYTILPINILNSVPRGFIGIHNSKLPAYRGHSPLVWQMINGEKEAGYSIFSFTEGMDDGDIWHQGHVEIDCKDYICDVMEKIENVIMEFIDRNFIDILNGTIIPLPQSSDNISYAGRRAVEDGEINWKEDNDRIYDFIRAQSKPYPGAFSMYNGEKIIIWHSEKFEFPIYGIPGQVGLINKKEGEIVIVCGNNRGLKVREVEINGQMRMAVDCIKSLKYKFTSI